MGRWAMLLSPRRFYSSVSIAEAVESSWMISARRHWVGVLAIGHSVRPLRVQSRNGDIRPRGSKKYEPGHTAARPPAARHSVTVTGAPYGNLGDRWVNGKFALNRDDIDTLHFRNCYFLCPHRLGIPRPLPRRARCAVPGGALGPGFC